VEYHVGSYEDRSDQQGWDAYAAALRAWMLEGRWDERVGGGESFEEIRRRFVPFVERLKREYGGSAAALALVGHGGTYRLMLPQVLVNVTPSFALEHQIANTSYVLAELRGSELVCLRWCELGLPR
jgi:broad specificity phosphatase PhoE